ncbi:uncharacterized protein LOC107847515 isoform X4 [Capsicum annuum]|uniref:uncharacterized protein LOC107847515 isoform X4 n=1 Tax=Capsicum annuum TaxID=4072 RepID=UPI001FB12962|nr:uncharacterized protein LOC107847515 isoform X4 [Capsicum annuum]
MSEKIKKSQKQKGKVEKSRREKGEEADVAFIYGRCFFIISSKVSTFRSKLKMNYLGALEGIHLKSPKSLTRIGLMWNLQFIYHQDPNQENLPTHPSVKWQ